MKRKIKSSLPNVAEEIRKLAGRNANLIMVGPALVYGDDDVSIMIVTGPPGRISSITLGRYVPEPDDDLVDIFDNVIMILRGDEITISQARRTRLQLISGLGAYFDAVVTFDSDKALAAAYAERFPSEKSLKLAMDVLKDLD
jgi:hypothetical protein